MRMLQISLVMLSVLFLAPGQAQETNQMNMEILKEKINADKKLIIANNMTLSDAEAKNFWPLYDADQKELEQINQRMITTIKSYADAYNAGKGEISNHTAKKLLAEALAVDESEVKLRQSHPAKMGKVLPATKVARYIQIENKIRVS